MRRGYRVSTPACKAGSPRETLWVQLPPHAPVYSNMKKEISRVERFRERILGHPATEFSFPDELHNKITDAVKEVLKNFIVSGTTETQTRMCTFDQQQDIVLLTTISFKNCTFKDGGKLDTKRTIFIREA